MTRKQAGGTRKGQPVWTALAPLERDALLACLGAKRGVGAADLKRLEQVNEVLAGADECREDAVLAALWPGMGARQAESHFRAFRSRIVRATGSTEWPTRLVVTRKTAAKPNRMVQMEAAPHQGMAALHEPLARPPEEVAAVKKKAVAQLRMSPLGMMDAKAPPSYEPALHIPGRVAPECQALSLPSLLEEFLASTEEGQLVWRELPADCRTYLSRMGVALQPFAALGGDEGVLGFRLDAVGSMGESMEAVLRWAAERKMPPELPAFAGFLLCLRVRAELAVWWEWDAAGKAEDLFFSIPYRACLRDNGNALEALRRFSGEGTAGRLVLEVEPDRDSMDGIGAICASRGGRVLPALHLVADSPPPAHVVLGFAKIVKSLAGAIPKKRGGTRAKKELEGWWVVDSPGFVAGLAASGAAPEDIRQLVARWRPAGVRIVLCGADSLLARRLLSESLNEEDPAAFHVAGDAVGAGKEWGRWIEPAPGIGSGWNLLTDFPRIPVEKGDLASRIIEDLEASGIKAEVVEASGPVVEVRATVPMKNGREAERSFGVLHSRLTPDELGPLVQAWAPGCPVVWEGAQGLEGETQWVIGPTALLARLRELGRVGASTQDVAEDEGGGLYCNDRWVPSIIWTEEGKGDFCRQESEIQPTASIRPPAGEVREGRHEREVARGKEQFEEGLCFLGRWLAEPDRPFAALLGELGVGKTFMCRMWARELFRRLEDNPSGPVPIYLDFRALQGKEGEVPTLEELIEGIVKAQGVRQLRAETVIELVRSGDMVMIFDGVDEKTAHLTSDQARRFWEQLRRIVESARRPATMCRGGARGGSAEPKGPGRTDGGGLGRMRGKALIACRTHYFKELSDGWRQMAGASVGFGPQGFRKEDFRLGFLQRFTPDQAQEYLHRWLGKEQGDAAWEVIRQTYNLEEMARQPYLLSLMTERVQELAARASGGSVVNAAGLYELVIEAWLERDATKHHRLSRDEKKDLTEELAWELWRRGAKSLTVRDLEKWVRSEGVGLLPGLVSRADLDPIEAELRTASFIVWGGPHGGTFSFAHTSFLEFFLARRLLRALCEDEPERFILPPISMETARFAAGLAAIWPDGEDRVRTGLDSFLRGPGEPKAARNGLVLRMQLRALEEEPDVLMDGYDLSGVDLSGLRLSGCRFQDCRFDGACAMAQDLSQAAFTRCSLVEIKAEYARWDGASLADCDLSDALLAGGSWRGSRLENCVLDRTDFSGGTFIDGSLATCRGARPVFNDCRLARTTAVDSKLPEAMVSGYAAFPADQTLCRATGVPAGRGRGTGELRERPRRLFGVVRALAVSPDGRRFATGCNGGMIAVGNLQRMEWEKVWGGHGGDVNRVGFSPDGLKIVSAGDDGIVRIWDADNGTNLACLTGHQGRVFSSSFSPDGRTIVSAGTEGTVRVWDAEGGTLRASLTGPQGWVMSSSYSPDGSKIVSAGSAGTVHIWDADKGISLLSLLGHTGFVRASSFSPDGRKIVSAGDDGTVRIWDADKGTPLNSLSGHSGSVKSSSFSPNGRKIVSAGTDGVRVWDADNGAPLASLTGHQGIVWSSSFSADGRKIVSAGSDRTVHVCDADTCTLLASFAGYRGCVTSASFSADGRKIVSAGSDGTVRVWDADKCAPLLSLTGHQGIVWSSSFSADGRKIVSAGSDGMVRVWDADKGTPLLSLAGHRGRILSSSFSPSGRKIVSAGEDGSVRVWDADTGTALASLSGHHGRVLCSSFSPDGRTITSAGDDRTVRVWDVDAGTLLLSLTGHQTRVLSSSFSPDGRKVVSAGEDGSVRVWDADKGTALDTISGREERVLSSSFSSDGRKVASPGSDGTVRVLDALTGSLLETFVCVPGGVGYCMKEPEGTVVGWSPGAEQYLCWEVDGVLFPFDAIRSPK